MTPAEIALMRRIIAWRKANRIEFVTIWQGCSWRDTLGETGPAGRQVEYDTADTRRTLGTCAGRHHELIWHEAGSFTEAVDILVAKGYLPQRFSTAYRAGWDVGREDIEHPCAAGAEFRAIMPAVEA